MSIQFIIGRSGSGKSSLVLEQVRTRLREDPSGPPIIILVPEQGTFQIERALVGTEELKGTIRAQVLGFRRLALRVMQETGGSALIPISDEGKRMLLYKIMRRRRSELKLYKNAGDQLGLIDRLNILYTEMKKYMGDAAALEDYYSQLREDEGESPLLKDKLHDLSLLYKEFEEELSHHYVDAEDHVTKLAEGAEKSEFLRNCEIWIDGFYTFTPKEYEAIGQLLKSASKVRISLTLDKPYDHGTQPHELDLFHPTALAYMKLRALAESLYIDIEDTVVLDAKPYPRFVQSETLAHLESAYEKRIRWRGELPADFYSSLSLHAAPDRRAEVEESARAIVSLVRDKGSRWRDIAVFVRNLSDYEHIAASVFEDYDIPYFLDQKRSVLHHPLVEYLRASLDVVQKYWKYDDVFRCVKTDFVLPLDGSINRNDMDTLENYVLASGVHGSRWTDQRPWKGRPSLSLETSADETSAASGMERIELCRQAIASPLGAFEKRLKKGKTVREKCEAVYRLLEDIEAPQRLDLLAHHALTKGHPQEAMEHRQLWGAILDLLDQMVEMMGEEILSNEIFAGILGTGLESLKLALVPPSLDQVLIGSTDRTRTSHVKHVFLLGVNEGVMPALIQEEGILTDQERTTLAKTGMQLSPGITRQLLDERFLIYHALSAASCSLWVSYPSADEDGKALLPSEVIRHIYTIFPALRGETQGSLSPAEGAIDMAKVTHPSPTLTELIGQLRLWKTGTEIAPVWWDVLEWYRSRPEWSAKLNQLLGSLGYRNRTHALTPATSRKLYGKRLRTSVSRMERFASCPFSHFASHGLKLRERQLYRLKAPDIGQLFHAALSSMAITFKEQNRSWGSLSADECIREAEAAVDKLAPKLQGEILLSSKRYGYISRKLKNIVGRASVILGEQSRRGSFEPIGLELDFGPGRTLPPLTFELPNGCVMEIVGRIDRVDMAEGEQGILLRVIDYKSSQTDLKLHEVYYGLSLQMLTYLDVIISSAEEWLGNSAVPAGALYFHVHNPLLQSANGLDPQQAGAEMLKRFKMKGLLMADKDIISHMDGLLEKGYSDILPVALKTDGTFYSSASVATPDQWDTLLQSVRNTIKGIGTRITEGDVAIEPYRIGQETACTHCSYRSVCQFDETMEDNKYNMLIKPGKEQTWDLLGERSRQEDSEWLSSGAARIREEGLE
ncbi:helicase-exonuclease AddAB subunit AddB [Paenibacillus zeisoli]|uniref:ATP-dependent helicase/deoxyribonuclease subunit B n=1 Tax=Paenibacillus zeisoli TaxID=2496267 RepID=A0A3S1DAE6_9BACL|nr:helicase-exonuclease AddAB subunit AddB [Paenibacillus zeisoli]RUT36437.1 helicase-exonuclease AddAB subunit AddB [Paenibacillus zeisoli]